MRRGKGDRREQRWRQERPEVRTGGDYFRLLTKSKILNLKSRPPFIRTGPCTSLRNANFRTCDYY